MIELATRKRVLAAAAVTAVAAGLSRLLFMLTGYFYVVPAAVAGEVTGANVPVSYLLALVLPPLAGVVFWRRPWWVRWACLGVLLHNVWLGFYVKIFWS